MKYLLLIFITILFNGCGIYKVFISPKNLKPLQNNSNIFYEQNSKQKALYISTLLDEQIKLIEKKQYLPFKKSPKIYVFTKQSSFEKYALNKKAGAETQGDKKILISPKKQNTTKRLKGLITHELSHFHIYSYTGLYRGYFLPKWFIEGLAVFVSGGVGAENVSKQKAIKAIKQNHIITLNNSINNKNIKPHMFYRQSEMFVKYLYNIDKEKFKKFIILILEKNDFNNSFKKIYNKEQKYFFQNFIKNIKG